MDEDRNMKRDPRLPVAAVAVCLLAACGGRGGGGGANGGDGTTPPPPPLPPPVISFTDLEASARAMAGKYLDPVTGDLLPSVGRTDALNLPVSGSATYDGYIAGRVSGGALDGNAMVGTLSLTTEFAGTASGAISGSATGFLDQNDTSYTGSLAVTGRTAPTAGYQLSADMAGTLGSTAGSFDVDVLMDGDFVGTIPDAVAGVADGDVAGGLFTGAFAADR